MRKLGESLGIMYIHKLFMNITKKSKSVGISYSTIGVSVKLK
jgi:hypothetical protein